MWLGRPASQDLPRLLLDRAGSVPKLLRQRAYHSLTVWLQYLEHRPLPYLFARFRAKYRKPQLPQSQRDYEQQKRVWPPNSPRLRP